MLLARKAGQARAQGRNFCYLLPPTQSCGASLDYIISVVSYFEALFLFASPAAENAGNVIKQAACNGIFVVRYDFS